MESWEEEESTILESDWEILKIKLQQVRKDEN